MIALLTYHAAVGNVLSLNSSVYMLLWVYMYTSNSNQLDPFASELTICASIMTVLIAQTSYLKPNRM